MGLSLAVQVVLYGQEPETVTRLVDAVVAAGHQARLQGAVTEVVLALGDNSAGESSIGGVAPSLNERGTAAGLSSVSYTPFERNIGHGQGHNRLAALTSSDVLVVLNPDTYPAPNLFTELTLALADPSVGIAEARQIPLEHPKEFDLVHGDTPWASGCCFAVSRETFDAVGGFEESFFLDCDDVDLSWRVRIGGLRVLDVPSAPVFHDKRPTESGYPEPRGDEAYHAGVGRLLLAWRAGRPDVLARFSQQLDRGTDDERRAATEFRHRRAEGTLPGPYPQSDVPLFVGGELEPRRF